VNWEHKLLNDVPRDWLTQVLECLPTRQLFQLKRMNKEWKRMCEYLIKYRKTVELNHVKGNSSGLAADSHVIHCSDLPDKHKDLMYNSLKEMLFVKHIHVWSQTEANSRNDIELIRPNAETLRVIHLVSGRMPADQTVTYGKLKKLSCESFDASFAGQMFPKLQDLTVNAMIRNVSPASLMLNLTKFTSYAGKPDADISRFVVMHSASLVTLRCYSILSDEEVEFKKLTDLSIELLPVKNVIFPVLEKVEIRRCTSSSLSSLSRLPLVRLKEFILGMRDVYEQKDGIAVCSLVSQMVNLTHLKLTDLYVNANSGPKFPDLFANMNKLESVTITRFGFVKYIRVDSNAGQLYQKWLSSLFQNNPLLSDVHMDIPVSTKTLILCSNLTNLQSAKFPGYGFTITGAMALLKGSSRNVMRETWLKVLSGVIAQVEQEIEAMELGRGVTFCRKHEMGDDMTKGELKFWLP
jgi:hypothetical protein